jgi:hypothetical protein
MENKIVYNRDGRQMISLDREEVELAKIYLSQESGSPTHRRINAMKKLKQESEFSVSHCGDLVFCAWEQENAR